MAQCATPGCTFRWGHDGCHSCEVVLNGAGRTRGIRRLGGQQVIPPTQDHTVVPEASDKHVNLVETNPVSPTGDVSYPDSTPVASNDRDDAMGVSRNPSLHMPTPSTTRMPYPDTPRRRIRQMDGEGGNQGDGSRGSPGQTQHEFSNDSYLESGVVCS